MVILVAIIVGINAAFRLKDNLLGRKNRTEVTPQPLDVRLVAEFVKREECQTRHADAVKGIMSLENQMEELRVERKNDTNELHDKVNGVAREVSELKSTTALQNQHLARMDAKLDRLVERSVERL